MWFDTIAIDLLVFSFLLRVVRIELVKLTLFTLLASLWPIP
jgi:hypothetical protein